MATDNSVAELQSMGFEAGCIREALLVCSGNVERAIDYLLAVDDDNIAVAQPTTTSNAPSSTSSLQTETTAPVVSTTSRLPRMIVAHDVSQYSFENGRSACTCIALRAASSFLENPSLESLSPEYLERVIQEGVVINSELFVSSGGVEHVSAEEALQKDRNHQLFGRLRMAGNIRQGLLHKNPRHPRGLLTMLLTCRKENKRNEWMAIVFTKTPESIVLFLPPEGSSLPFILLDSHPRPTLQANGAYLQFHSSLESFLHPLLTIFPPMNLGPDVAEWMDMVYNSFDLYPLFLDNAAA